MAKDRSVNIPKLASAYRRLVLWFGVQLVVSLGGLFLSAVIGDPAIAGLIALGQLAILLVTIVMLAIYAYRTAGALGSSVPVVWAIAMVVPWVNLLVLLILSSRSTQACRSAGVPVGLLGPKDIEREQAQQVQTFE